MNNGRCNPPIIERAAGVLYSLGQCEMPTTVEHHGLTYHRFHDFIYLTQPIEDLSQAQVRAVCAIREEFATHEQLSSNRRIRKHFIELINALGPKFLVELGPGVRPLFSRPPTMFRYELVEIDDAIVRQLVMDGYSASQIGEVASLNLPPNCVDLVVAVFVFQFNMSTSQINEILRVLAKSGIIVANVYRRSSKSREQLKEHFERRECRVKIIRCNCDIGHEHEYWVVGRDRSASCYVDAITVLEEGLIHLSPDWMDTQDA